MKGLKFSAIVLCGAMLFSGCSMSNTAKGGLIGGGGGGALGALIGQLAGGGKGAAIGAAIGTTLGAGAGVIIGNKMDKAKKAAEAANAQAELLTDNEGYTYVKVTFPSGILFSTGNYSLSNGARNDLATFATGLDADMDIYIYGYTDNQGWKNSTAEQSKAKNQTLSLQRAQSVSNYLLSCGLNSAQILKVMGMGESNPVADNTSVAGREQNRRVEVYVLPSKKMVEDANRAAGK
ncbi:MAG: OmpA family protein [Bacteroidaceae bacterium]|nr:OmpA family protein [Bacteroidaceae bacterium]